MTNFACAPIDGIEDTFLPHVLKGAMAARYCRAASLDINDGFAAAVATWETEWEHDPEPRNFDHAMEAVDDDLAYWGKD